MTLRELKIASSWREVRVSEGSSYQESTVAPMRFFRSNQTFMGFSNLSDTTNQSVILPRVCVRK